MISSEAAFKRVELNRNSAYYRFLIHICELVHAQLLPDERGSGFSFLEVLEDEVRMSNVFEEFIRNFFRIEQNYFRPGKRRIAWDIDWISEEANAVLPVMENDVRLDAPDETIVIDAKYYKSALKAPRGRASYQGRERLISANLYQIYSYLKNLAPTIEDGRLLRGILVYPAAARSVDVEMVVQGHHIRVFTVNLDQEWRGIHSDLLSLLETPRTAVVHPR